jgi:NADH-quinone oxidoreductase subunit N
MTVLLLAQAGVPLTSGFIAKFGVIRSAVSVESYPLAIIAMVAAVVAAYLYLRIMVSMWMQESSRVLYGQQKIASRFVVLLVVGTSLGIGFFPTGLLRFTSSLSL